jgi:hypothetical protein
MMYSLNGFEVTTSLRRLRLKTRPTSWRKSVTSMNVDFGQTTDRHSFRKHEQLVRRDNTQTVTVTESNSQPPVTTTTIITTKPLSSSSGSAAVAFGSLTTVVPPVVNVTIPSDLAPFPSGAPLYFNLTFQKLNQSIDIPILPPPAPQTDLRISVGCKNCTTSGSLDLTAGNFAIQPNNILNMQDVIQNGSVSLSMVEGFQAHIELDTIVTAQGSLSIPLFQVPVLGFTIPGIGRAGLTFSTDVIAQFNISDALQLDFGFEVNVSTLSTHVQPPTHHF